MIARRGFTLIEVLVALALLAVLVAMVSMMLWTIDIRRDEIIRVSESNRAATVLIDTIERQAAITFVATREGRPGIRGDATSLTMRGRMATLEVGGSLDDARSPHRAVGITAVRLSSGVLSAGRSSDEREPDMLAMPGRFERVRFRYHNGDGWRSSFDSVSAGRLPVAIEVAVWFAPSDRSFRPDDGSPPPLSVEREIDDAIPSMFDDGTADASGIPDALRREPAAREPDRLRVVVIVDAADAEQAGAEETGLSGGIGGER